MILFTVTTKMAIDLFTSGFMLSVAAYGASKGQYRRSNSNRKTTTRK